MIIDLELIYSRQDTGGKTGNSRKGMNGEPESLETGKKGKRTGRKEGKQEKMCPETSESESE